MNKKKERRQLGLRRATIRRLSDQELQANGAALDNGNSLFGGSCNSCTADWGQCGSYKWVEYYASKLWC